MDAMTNSCLGCAVILVGIPLLLGFTVSRLLAEPFFEVAQAYNPEIFHPTALQRAEGGREVHKHQLRLRMEVAIGRIEPLSDEEMIVGFPSLNSRHSVHVPVPDMFMVVGSHPDNPSFPTTPGCFSYVLRKAMCVPLWSYGLCVPQGL